MTEEGARRVIVIKHNRYARPAPCSICNTDHHLSIGPALFEEGSWEGVCEECARVHAPGLVAMLDSRTAQRAYWEAEEAAGEAHRRQVGENLASLEMDVELLRTRLEATHRRLEELRGEGEE